MNVVGIVVAISVAVILFAFLFGGVKVGGYVLGGYAVVLGIIAVYALSFGLTALLVWGIIKCMLLVGITSIGSWQVAFSWPLAGLIWLVYIFLHGIFSVTVHKN